MTESKFLVDECLARPRVEDDLAKSLRLFGGNASIEHLLSKFPSGCADIDWISQIARERNWIVITSDQGKNSIKSEKLPIICQYYGVTHVVLSSGLHKRSMYFKILAIQSSWESLLELHSHPKGSGFQIAMKNKGGDFRFKKIREALPSSDLIDPNNEKHQMNFLDNI